MKLLNDKQQQTARRNYGKTIFRYLGALTLAVSSVFFLTSCADSASDRAEKTGGITARQVIENPSAYVGKTVTVSGDVEEIWGPKAFNMDSGVSVGELLVVGREPFPQVGDAGNRAYVINDVATVTGTIRMLVTADVEREIGWDLDPQIEAKFNAKPVLIAQSINFRAGAAAGNTATMNANGSQTAMNANQMTANNNGNMMSGSNANQMAANDNAGQTASGNKLTDAGVYGSTSDKLSLVGKEVEFSNLRVTRVVGPRTFTVASGSGEMYVMLDENSARGVGSQGNIGIGKTLSLTGKFERLEASEINDISNNRFRPLTAAERDFLKNTPVFLQTAKISDLK